MKHAKHYKTLFKIDQCNKLLFYLFQLSVFCLLVVISYVSAQFNNVKKQYNAHHAEEEECGPREAHCFHHVARGGRPNKIAQEVRG